jgi:hypothetical protein
MKYKILFAPCRDVLIIVIEMLLNSFSAVWILIIHPFLRIERKEIRTRDIVGIKPEINHVPSLIPQILADTKEDFEQLCLSFSKMDISVSISFGCPFPLITNK